MTPLFSTGTVLLASSQSCRSVDADALRKRALRKTVCDMPLNLMNAGFTHHRVSRTDDTEPVIDV